MPRAKVKVAEVCGHKLKDWEYQRQGRCQACYKREIWRPSGSPAVARSDMASRMSPYHSRFFPPFSRPRAAAQCKSCSRFKSRPSSVCEYCGDDPVSGYAHTEATEMDRMDYDKAMGWD